MNRILGNLGKTDINEKKIKITLMDGIQKKKYVRMAEILLLYALH